MKTKTYAVITDNYYTVRSLGAESKTLDADDVNSALSVGNITANDLRAAGVPNYYINTDDTGVTTLKYNENVDVEFYEHVELETKDAAKLMHFLAGWQYPVHVVTDDTYYRLVTEVKGKTHQGASLVEMIADNKEAVAQQAVAELEAIDQPMAYPESE